MCNRADVIFLANQHKLNAFYPAQILVWFEFIPDTEIKIDKSFVDRCLSEKRIRSLLEAITSIGQRLNLEVVAEGVETKEQFELLQEIRCPVIQGYFFSRPLPAEDIPGWMTSALPLRIDS